MEEKEISSGAEKVERVQAQAEKKVASAREKVLEEKAKAKAQLREERAKRKEMLANETEAQRLKRKEQEKKERLARKAQQAAEQKELALEKKEAQLKRKEQRLAEREHKREKKDRTPGFGGWLAAVISLGVITLILGTTVMVGAFNMMNTNGVMMSGYRSSLYELVGLMDEIETDLDKLRVANSVSAQQRLATDLYVNAALAEGVLERVPLEGNETVNVTGFVNNMSAFSQEMLKKLHAGSGMTAEQEAKLEQLYAKQEKVKQELNTLVNSMSDQDLFAMFRGEAGRMQESFSNIENYTAEEEQPKAQPTSALDSAEEVSASKAEELCRKYFEDYQITEAHFAGEAITDGVQCYNFEMTDSYGRGIFAQISKKGGKLIQFDSYEECEAKNFDLEMCEDIAEEFLQAMGFDDMEVVWVSENGTQVTFTYVQEEDDVLLYPDRVLLKVCETRGKVVGMEAATYWKNHTSRTLPAPVLTRDQAKAKLRTTLNVMHSDLCVIPVDGEEVLCYEFAGKMGERMYFVYVDAQTGEEVELYKVENTKQGQIRR